MIRKILKLFNRKIVYVCEWGVYDSRIGFDPFHRCTHKAYCDHFKIAPQWAKLKIVKIKS